MSRAHINYILVGVIMPCGCPVSLINSHQSELIVTPFSILADNRKHEQTVVRAGIVVLLARGFTHQAVSLKDCTGRSIHNSCRDPSATMKATSGDLSELVQMLDTADLGPSMREPGAVSWMMKSPHVLTRRLVENSVGGRGIFLELAYWNMVQ